MRSTISPVTRGALLALLVTGCGSNNEGPLDSRIVDAAPDAPPDAACERTLLTGGTDVAAQGWTVGMLPPSTLSNGADYVELQTTTTTGQQTSGQLLLSYAGAFAAGAAFKLEVVALVQAVNPHNQFDAAAAIMGSFTPAFGTQSDRSTMIFLDSGAIGWSDNTQTHAVAVTDGAYHTYVLAVDAAQTAQVTIDGAAALTRTGFTSTGTIAVGDQTNDRNVDSMMRIRSVRLLCP